MFEQYRIEIDYKPRQRQLLNGLLALATGILTLGYPNFLYLIVGGYLLALGLLFMAFRIPAGHAALPIVAGGIILIFPELIPFTFAGFLTLFGLVLVISFQFSLLGVITLVIAALTFANPGWIAYTIAVFLLVYAVSNLIRLYRESGMRP